MSMIDRLKEMIGAPAAGGPVQATWNGVVIAQSDHTIIIEGNHYFPPQDVRSEYLERSDRYTTCPWKGTASYYDVVVDGQRNSAAAWYYPQPKPAAKEIAGHVAFWHGVKVKPLPVEAPAAA
jgi:uncharacterized protein (DUF427 family)